MKTHLYMYMYSTKSTAQWLTIAEDDEHDEVDGRHDAVALDAASRRPDPVVHHRVPILARNDLKNSAIRYTVHMDENTVHSVIEFSN